MARLVNAEFKSIPSAMVAAYLRREGPEKMISSGGARGVPHSSEIWGQVAGTLNQAGMCCLRGVTRRHPDRDISVTSQTALLIIWHTQKCISLPTRRIAAWWCGDGLLFNVIMAVEGLCGDINSSCTQYLLPSIRWNTHWRLCVCVCNHRSSQLAGMWKVTTTLLPIW